MYIERYDVPSQFLSIHTHTYNIIMGLCLIIFVNNVLLVTGNATAIFYMWYMYM